jgi:hypothetical protein
MTETPREAILTEAAGLITGDRNKTYGSPTENFSNTAALWSVQIGHKLTEPLTAAEVAQLMVQLKMARMIAQPKRDNFVDAAGYIACGWECEEADSALKPTIRYATDSDGWIYRWDGSRLTFVEYAGAARKTSVYSGIEVLWADLEDTAYEIPIDEVPEWAR